jgi:hypothetical protein
LRQVVMGLHLKEGGESGQLAIEPWTASFYGVRVR